MHLETTHPQCLVPRLPQRLVRGYAVQSVQVVQAATDQSADDTAHGTSDGASDGASDAGGFADLALRRFVAAAVGLCAAARVCTARRWRRWWRLWVFAFISV
jgi:hypothetical protein